VPLPKGVSDEFRERATSFSCISAGQTNCSFHSSEDSFSRGSILAPGNARTTRLFRCSPTATGSTIALESTEQERESQIARSGAYSRFATLGSTTVPSGSRTTKTCLICFLPANFGRFLIIPQSQEDRMAQAIIRGPFRKFNFANHRRSDPNAPFHFGGG
jgi:hypothetical protein